MHVRFRLSHPKEHEREDRGEKIVPSILLLRYTHESVFWADQSADG